MIIHISGFPGSGKTTLGELIAKTFKGVVVQDTDEFIQHHTKEGKQLMLLEKEKKWAEYKALWKATMKAKIAEVVEVAGNRPVVFVGSLDNFAPPVGGGLVIFKIKADYKFLLNVPLAVLMKRYYSRVYLEDHRRTKKASADYWAKLADGAYQIASSESIIKDHVGYNMWHERNGYKFLDDKAIMRVLSKVLI